MAPSHVEELYVIAARLTLEVWEMSLQAFCFEICDHDGGRNASLPYSAIIDGGCCAAIYISERSLGLYREGSDLLYSSSSLHYLRRLHSAVIAMSRLHCLRLPAILRRPVEMNSMTYARAFYAMPISSAIDSRLRDR